jgi:hypothetical protein
MKGAVRLAVQRRLNLEGAAGLPITISLTTSPSLLCAGSFDLIARAKSQLGRTVLKKNYVRAHE